MVFSIPFREFLERVGVNDLWLFLFSLLLAAAGFFSNEAALVAAAVFSLVLPGYSLCRILKTDFNSVELIAFSVLSSVLLSTWIVYLASLALGYSRSTILLVFVLFAFFFLASSAVNPAFGCHSEKREKSETRGNRGNKGKHGKSESSEWLLPVACALVVFALFFAALSNSLWVERGDSVIVGGWNWGDFFVHLGIIQSINAGNFPPQEQTFAGVPMIYHFFVDFHTAFVSKVADVFCVLIVRFENAFYAALLFLLAYAFGLFYSRNRQAALLAAVLVVFGGGFCYLTLFQDVGAGGNIQELLKQKNYDKNDEFFKIPSLLNGYLIVQRPQMIGLPALAAVLLLVVSGYPNKKNRLLLAGLLCGLSAPFQYYAFASSVFLCVLFFALRFVRGRVFDLKALLCFFIPCLIAVPFVFAAVFRASTAKMLVVRLGWDAPKDAFLFPLFYFANFGLPFLLALAALFFSRAREKLFLVAWFAAMFAVTNLFSFSNFSWDMCKFLSFAWLPVCLLASVFIVEKTPRWLWPALVFFSVLSPLLALSWNANSDWVGLNAADVRVAKWIEANTPERAVFAAYTVHNTPVELAGRLRVTGFSGWMWNYGLPFREREEDLHAIYCGSEAEARAALKKYSVEYVYFSENERKGFDCSHEFQKFMRLVYSSDGREIYALN